jgi:hypothetical protein
MAHETIFENGTNITSYLATGFVEGFEEAESEKDIIRAWSYLIGTKIAYSLQGSFGRQASILIDRGLISSDGTINWEIVDNILDE